MEKNKKENSVKKVVKKTNSTVKGSKVVKEQPKEEKNNLTFIIILFAVVIIMVLFLPKIYKAIQTLSMPKIDNSESEEIVENKEITEEILETIHYPIMRNSIYNSNTYYSLEKFTINDMSNNDILYNAFLDIYEGNMTPFEGMGSCTNVSKQFDENYIELRIKNILGKKTNYTLESFYVPEDSKSNYPGTWNYDSYNGRFTYNGLCQSNATNIKYYDLEQLVKYEYEDNDIVVYYYVGFAKVEGNNYVIYKDASMTQSLKEGTISDSSELNSIFNKIDNNQKNIYKYTFKDTICSYNEYCLYEGKWVDEL